MNPTPSAHDDESLVRSLRSLRPSATPLDPAVVFYRMGHKAGRHEAKGDSEAKVRRTFLSAAAALLLAAGLSAAVVGPVGYRLGRASHGTIPHTAPDQQSTPMRGPILVDRDSALAAEASALAGQRHAVPSVDPLPANSENQRTVRHDAAEPAAETPDQLATPTPLAWPRLRERFTAWLSGGVWDRPLARSSEVSRLTHQLASPRGDADWFAGGLRSPNPPLGGVTAARSDAASEQQTAPPPNPRRYTPLRATDWKEVIESDNIF